MNDAFMDCFHEKSDLTSIIKLEVLENQLEQFYLQADCILPRFLKERQTEIDKERREIQRAERQKKDQEIINQKNRKVMERATEVPVEKNLRPLRSRMLPPQKRYVFDDYEKILAEQREQQLLYGEVKE